MSSFCLTKNALELTPSSVVEASIAGSDEWHDYVMCGSFVTPCGTAVYFYLYRQDENNWYRMKIDYANQAVTMQRSLSTDSPMISDLGTESRSLLLNVLYPFTFEVNLNALARIPCVFYEPGDGTFTLADIWTTESGSPSYVGGYLNLASGAQVQANEDVNGPCIEAADEIMDECGCAAIEEPPTTAFDMGQYCTSFVVRNTTAGGRFVYYCHWDFDVGQGVQVTFNLSADTVTIQAVQVGSPTVLAAANASFTMDHATDYTIWVDAYGGDYTVYWNDGGTATEIVSLTDATYSSGDFGFASAVGTTSIKEIICCPRDHEDFDCPWLVWLKSASTLQTRDGASGAFDGITISDRSTNFLRFTMGQTELTATDESLSEGTVAVETAALTHLYLPGISVTPIRTACRDNVAI